MLGFLIPIVVGIVFITSVVVMFNAIKESIQENKLNNAAPIQSVMTRIVACQLCEYSDNWQKMRSDRSLWEERTGSSAIHPEVPDAVQSCTPSFPLHRRTDLIPKCI